MTNDEARMTNQTAMTNDKRARSGTAARGQGGVSPARRHCRFVIHSSFGIRHSAFGILPVVGLLLACTTLMGGCGSLFGPRQARRDVYMNLMTPVQQAQFRYLEATERPASLKLAYLQEIGVYQLWAEQPKDIQAAILRYDVIEGMTPLQVQMAWGLPDEKRDVTEPAERAGGHAKTVWEYRIRAQKGAGGSYERSVCLLDDRVLWVRRTR
jgi:hypothetical protein